MHQILRGQLETTSYIAGGDVHSGAAAVERVSQAVSLTILECRTIVHQKTLQRPRQTTGWHTYTHTHTQTYL